MTFLNWLPLIQEIEVTFGVGVGLGEAVVLTVPAADILLAAPADDAIKSKLGFSEISSIGSGNSKPKT